VSEMLSYEEFQLPSAPSVGSHCGKQSKASSYVMWRMITFGMLLTRTCALRMRASEPRPTSVVLLVRLTRIRFCCFVCAATRAVSSGPLGTRVRPQVAGSNGTRYASSESTHTGVPLFLGALLCSCG